MAGRSSGSSGVGRVTGVVEDGEPWYCELHPDPRYASCHASLVPPPIGERYQVSCIPELQPRCRPCGPASADGVGDGEERAGDSPPSPSTERHAMLRPLPVEELGLPNRSAARRRGGRRGRKGGGGGRRPVSRAGVAELPEGDSQRYDFIGYADDSDDEEGADADAEEQVLEVEVEVEAAATEDEEVVEEMDVVIGAGACHARAPPRPQTLSRATGASSSATTSSRGPSAASVHDGPSSVYDDPSDDDDSSQEVIPVPKRRRLSPVGE